MLFVVCKQDYLGLLLCHAVEAEILLICSAILPSLLRQPLECSKDPFNCIDTVGTATGWAFHI